MIATYQHSNISNFEISDFHFLDQDLLEFDSSSDVEARVEETAPQLGEPQNQAWHMKCECLNERHVFDLLDHVYRLHQVSAENTATKDQRSNHVHRTGRSLRMEPVTPILIYVTDYQEAVEIDRCLSAVKLRTHLASPFSNWTNVLGKLGTGQLDVIISTTAEIPYADQIPWQAIYLPSALHLAMLTTPQMDWLGNLWFANHRQETPPRLIIRRAKA
ncbi:MAG: hypothetical protein JNL67_11245 [Planctomycetaceae bacterium]|nr:hypothetical protein [Planctomycetaceae bacterium]